MYGNKRGSVPSDRALIGYIGCVYRVNSGWRGLFGKMLQTMEKSAVFRAVIARLGSKGLMCMYTSYLNIFLYPQEYC